MEVIKIEKTLFNKTKYPNIIDTNFTQLINNNITLEEDDISVDEFFIIYDRIFYSIPIDGELNSHKELIKRSTEYVGETQNTEEIDLLLEEINQLRLDLLESRQIIEDLTK